MTRCGRPDRAPGGRGRAPAAPAITCSVTAYCWAAASRSAASTGMAWICSGCSGACASRLAHMGEVAIRVSRRGHALIYLNDLDAGPRHVFAGQGLEHQPRSMAAADGHDEPAARGNRQPRLRGNDGRRLSGDRIGIGENLNLHEITLSPPRSPMPAAAPPVSVARQLPHRPPLRGESRRPRCRG